MEKARWHTREGLRQNPEYSFKWELLSDNTARLHLMEKQYRRQLNPFCSVKIPLLPRKSIVLYGFRQDNARQKLRQTVHQRDHHFSIMDDELQQNA